MFISVGEGIHSEVSCDEVAEDIGNALERIAVIDCDGTIRKGDQRLHLLPSQEYIQECLDKGNANLAWKVFNDASDGDTPLVGNIEMINRLFHDHVVIYLTSCTYSEKTSEVLKNQMKEWYVPCDLVLMRHPDNHLHPTDMKENFIKSLTKVKDPANIIAIDDCIKNCDMFNSYGVTTFKCYF